MLRAQYRDAAVPCCSSSRWRQQKLCPLQLCRCKPASRQATVAANAAADLKVDGNKDAGISSCPFLATTTQAYAFPQGGAAVQQQLDRDVSALAGPNNSWRVLQEGNTRQLPEPEGRWCFNPIVGEFLELESKGAGTFLLERFKCVLLGADVCA